MKNLINLLITFVVLIVGNMYFSEYISYDSTKTLIITTLAFFVIDMLYSFLMLGLIGVGFLGGTFGLSISIIVTVVTAFILLPIKLVLLDRLIPGFEINGFLTYFILVCVFSIFHVGDSSKKKS